MSIRVVPGPTLLLHAGPAHRPGARATATHPSATLAPSCDGRAPLDVRVAGLRTPGTGGDVRACWAPGANLWWGTAGAPAAAVVIRDRERPLASHAAARSRAVARRGARPGPPGPPLTAREREVAALLAARRTNGEIAAALGVSPHTARHHTERVLQKFGVTSRRALPAGLAAALAPGGPLFGA